MYLIEPIRNGKYIADGAVNLAMQVYVNQHIFLDEDILLPYYCDPKIEIGRFQNTAIEINQEYVDKHGIQVVRRDTGGGAVYVDKGAVNVCCILEQDTSIYGDFQRFYRPAIKALHHLGATDVIQSGRNDLTLHGKKISGAAMTVINNRIYGGYSLLLDVDYDAMVQSLNPNRKKIESKGIKSVRARVGNIRDSLAPEYQDITIQAFKDLIIKQIMGIDDISDAKRYTLTDEDWAGIDQLVADKYANWEWNYGHSPRYEYNRNARFACGTIDISLSVTQNRISGCSIFGDFFGQGDIHDVETHLVGTRMVKQDLIARLEDIDLNYYFGSLSAEELTQLILS
ncbi:MULTISPECIES: lipoate--protein ligase [Staphylococcus]|jgi:lipoate-protein ligase A|uniref:lipoate--protein ligase n=1 Tax=Staphylococcus lugdunensis TaxID=28035 RepID=A0ABX6BSS6_STALU|nr:MULTISPECIES: lipoate--protein ligase [Staphylococcus]ADC86402.1 Lipoate-protein ligase A [Staphylococcus lugdunensis HKU09-01]ARJ08151.1 lipoate--protein ligase [Staphylococcus lugdunensis]ARJ15244.1 lipoate--protein ligase [Staphylococcus lugdunensis]ARJ26333.1 lipoate--protein ligase [Staphylococcus lugdunensis]ARJ28627.1 lipoate--protein ligase [Staphylococcus lugdunensis]